MNAQGAGVLSEKSRGEGLMTLLKFIDDFVPCCPRDGAKLIGAITTQSLNARDGYEKASREVYFWCTSALPLLDSFIDALQQGHTDDAQTHLLAVYENGATIMRTVALALATTEKQLTGAKANVIALSSTCLATDSSESPVESAPEMKRLTAPDATTARAVSLVQFDNLVALAEAKTRPPVMEASSTLATVLLGLAHQIESMVQGTQSGWQQLAQTNVIHEIESEMRQPKLLQLLDEATIEAHITSAKALRAAKWDGRQQGTPCGDGPRRAQLSTSSIGLEATRLLAERFPESIVLLGARSKPQEAKSLALDSMAFQHAETSRYAWPAATLTRGRYGISKSLGLALGRIWAAAFREICTVSV
ncbi:hypothetical protein SPRG_22211 [Saprolegnia parasitica CBS 223.65]|uniref:Uncharacterized protein n=1 Tax=Saprolegnia parasitica (strain CBS 223.65) TaxID=695850 RepID=A0A067CC43_SAPPC|nr:hypothetical protein SPRG_22211 [Saprolegnia parasitica CBS 223.65]KDO26715.1 hypothetical protein SPRG_22211 [Saprolegnia parasitica CBS 223.65]|eukprot:XP_012202638.1 hypothetical protein SPRG_22211 [Saprolegnia parasitica CBS 223.65]